MIERKRSKPEIIMKTSRRTASNRGRCLHLLDLSSWLLAFSYATVGEITAAASIQENPNRRRFRRKFRSESSSSSFKERELQQDSLSSSNLYGDEVLILQFSMQHEMYPTVSSMEWSFIGMMENILDEFLCQTTPVMVLDVHFILDSSNDSNINFNNNIDETKITCSDDFDEETSGQLLTPTTLLTDGFNNSSTSHVSELRWIGWELHYPIYRVGDDYIQQAAFEIHDNNMTSSSSLVVTARDIMKDVVQSALSHSIADGTFNQRLKASNIPAKLSLIGNESSSFWNDGEIDNNNDDDASSTKNSYYQEDFSRGAAVLQVLGIIMLCLDILGLVCLSVWGWQKRIRAKEMKPLTTLSSSPGGEGDSDNEFHSWIGRDINTMLETPRQELKAGGLADGGVRSIDNKGDRRPRLVDHVDLSVIMEKGESRLFSGSESFQVTHVSSRSFTKSTMSHSNAGHGK